MRRCTHVSTRSAWTRRLALANLSTYSENVPDRKMDPTSVREIGKRHPRGGCTNRGGQYCVCRSGISISYLGNAWNGCVCSVPVIMSLILCSSHVRGGCIDTEFSFCEMHATRRAAKAHTMPGLERPNQDVASAVRESLFAAHLLSELKGFHVHRACFLYGQRL